MAMAEGTTLQVFLDGDNIFKKVFPDEDPGALLGGQLKGITTLDGGMSSGKPSVGLMIMTSEGRTCYAETSLQNLQMAMAMFIAKYGDQTDGAFEIRVGPEGFENVDPAPSD